MLKGTRVSFVVIYKEGRIKRGIATDYSCIHCTIKHKSSTVHTSSLTFKGANHPVHFRYSVTESPIQKWNPNSHKRAEHHSTHSNHQNCSLQYSRSHSSPLSLSSIPIIFPEQAHLIRMLSSLTTPMAPFVQRAPRGERRGETRDERGRGEGMASQAKMPRHKRDTQQLPRENRMQHSQRRRIQIEDRGW